jgi:hypothetical protein
MEGRKAPRHGMDCKPSAPVCALPGLLFRGCQAVASLSLWRSLEFLFQDSPSAAPSLLYGKGLTINAQTHPLHNATGRSEGNFCFGMVIFGIFIPCGAFLIHPHFGPFGVLHFSKGLFLSIKYPFQPKKTRVFLLFLFSFGTWWKYLTMGSVWSYIHFHIRAHICAANKSRR